MAEYIEREAAVAFLENMAASRYLVHCFESKERFPTADVVEVRHGYWVEENDGTHSCSECGHDATYTYDGTEVCGIGCPFCYAKMDGKEEK